MTNQHLFHYNQALPNMPSKRKYLYCDDTANTLGREDHVFQSFEEFKLYISLPLEEKNSNKVWTSRIALASCMPEV